jgi:dUTP pyrophosphatase
MSTIADLTTTPRLGVVRLDTNAKLPTKAHYGDLGYDLYALEDTVLVPGNVTIVRTGIACNFPPGFGALLRDRSSVATKIQVFVVAGVIDQGYTGEVKVAFWNHDCNAMVQPHKAFKAGDKIAQMILTPVVTIPIDEVTDLQTSSRGAGGFGSTGTV